MQACIKNLNINKVETMRVSRLSKSLGWSSVVAILVLLAGIAYANTDQLVQQGVGKVQDGIASQKKVDRIVDGAQKRLLDYRSLLKQVDGLKAYNEQLTKQVQAQRDLIVRFDKSIGDVALIERQISPLVTKMAGSVEDFVSIDLPFRTQERDQRIALLNEGMNSADINVAEKFRQVMEVYQIESEYARNIDTYGENIVVNGAEIAVDVLVVGRIALLAQSKDASQTFAYNRGAKAWEEISAGDYRNSVRQGIKMASKQAPINVLALPIALTGE